MVNETTTHTHENRDSVPTTKQPKSVHCKRNRCELSLKSIKRWLRRTPSPNATPSPTTTSGKDDDMNKLDTTDSGTETDEHDMETEPTQVVVYMDDSVVTQHATMGARRRDTPALHVGTVYHDADADVIDDQDQDQDVDTFVLLPPPAPRRPRRRTASVARVAHRWHITVTDAREMCDAVENAQWHPRPPTPAPIPAGKSRRRGSPMRGVANRFGFDFVNAHDLSHHAQPSAEGHSLLADNAADSHVSIPAECIRSVKTLTLESVHEEHELEVE
eukprot:m.12099 g.12099  ORF g.12099 m.12099 type:complete len:274 (+) comp2909_c0_seq1:436-1257(+)